LVLIYEPFLGCPFPLMFRNTVFHGYTKVESGGLDENEQKYTVCRGNVSGTTLLGKGYTWGETVRNRQYQYQTNYIYEHCWVAVANGTEVLVSAPDKVAYLQTKLEGNTIVWANILNFPDFPDISPPPVAIRTGPLANSTKQYVGRCNYETEDGLRTYIPGAINEDDVSKLIITYAGKVIECTEFEVPVCV